MSIGPPRVKRQRKPAKLCFKRVGRRDKVLTKAITREKLWIDPVHDPVHQRLQARPEFKLRVGGYRVLYEFDAELGRIYLHFVGHRREIYKR